MSLIGLVASLLSDGAEILTAVGIAIPPALVALPAAIGAEAIDIGAAILKNVRRLVNAEVFDIIKRIPFDKALQLGGDVLSQLAKRAYKEVGAVVGNWPGFPEGVFNLVQGILGSVWEPFVALVKHYGATGLGKLFTLGFGDGAFLAGRVLKQGGEFNDVDKVIEGIARIGDELGGAAADLSDEAAKALGGLVNGVGEEKTRRFLAAIPCGVAYMPNHRIAGLASPLRATLCTEALEQLKNLSPEAHDGLQRLLNTADVNEVAKIFNNYDETLRTAFFSTFANIEDDLLKKLVSGIEGDLVKLEDYLVKMGDAAELEELIRLAKNEGTSQITQRAGLKGVDDMVQLSIDTNTNLKRVKELATEIVGGKKRLDKTTLNEAVVGLKMEDAGELVRPIRRPPGGDTAPDIMDGSGQLWDVKSFDSAHGFDIDKELKNLKAQFDAKERVIIDVNALDDMDAVDLFIKIEERGWKSKVKWYIPPGREDIRAVLF